jgi:hypothetical protein
MKTKLLFLFLPIFLFSAEQKSALTEDRASYIRYFQSAADEFGVPVDVLKGISFAETRWSHLTWEAGDTAACTGMPHPYGIMSLWDNSFFGHSLRVAAALIGKDIQILQDDPQQNIRGAAALLTKLYDSIPIPAETNRGEIESWRNAIAAYSGLPRMDFAQQHALDIYSAMNEGYHQYGIEWNAKPVKIGEIKTAVSKIFRIEAAKISGLKKAEKVTTQPDYPLAKWVSSYPGTGAGDQHWYTTGYSHSFVIIHDMEGYYLSTISYFQLASTQASIYYCLNSKKDNVSDAPAGEITQMVEEKYWAWHVVCWNRYMFGIEHEGFVANPAWFTPEMYNASSQLVAYLCDKYGIPKDRNHIIGHNEWQNQTWKTWMGTNWPQIDVTCNNHTDPGQYWDWTGFMTKINASDTVTPEIVYSSVEGNNKIVKTYGSVSVQFNTSMDIFSTDSAFSLSPSVDGTITWNSDNTVLTFKPKSGFAFNTAYTLTVETTAKSIGLKHSLNGFPYTAQFTTNPVDTVGPKIVRSYPLNNAADVPLKPFIVLRMDDSVQTTSLSTTLKLYDPDNKTVSLSGAKNESVNDSALITFSPTLKPNQTYMLKLFPGVKDAYGNLSIDTTFIQFSTQVQSVVAEGTLIDQFESDSGNWVSPKLSAYSSHIDTSLTSFVISSNRKYTGISSGTLTYAFNAVSGSDAALELSLPISVEGSSTVGMMVFGDTSKNVIQFQFSPNNQIVNSDTVDWLGWKYLSVNLNLLTGVNKQLTAIRIMQKTGSQNSGVVSFDNLQLDATTTGVNGEHLVQPLAYSLDQNFPNPFNPSTSIKFTLARNERVQLKIFDLLGREVAVVVDGQLQAGTHSYMFQGRSLSSGVYFYTLRTEEFSKTRKMLLTK